MRATPDLPDHMTAETFRNAANDVRRKLAGIVPMNAMDCYSIAALAVSAEVFERIAEGECTFEALSGEMLVRQSALAKLYGVEP